MDRVTYITPFFTDSDDDQLDVPVIYDFVMYNFVLFFVYLERCRETFHRAPYPCGLHVSPIPGIRSGSREKKMS